MNLLLDSHTALWFWRDDPQLSANAKSLIEDPANRKLVSIASCWEIAIKAGLGRLQFEQLPIVSADKAFDQYGATRIW